MRAFAIAVLLLACSPPEPRGAGATCVRAAQCAPGLVCIGGVCSADVGAIEGGVAAQMDGSAPAD